MNSPQATLSKILTYSIVDGPGNRLVLFMQGCNYNCPTCHNPHTIGQCDHCGDCIPACHVNALSLRDGRISFDPTSCDQCDACLDICPISANPMVQTYSVRQILQIARKHRAFLSGLTVSGGEATLQFRFILALFTAIRADSELSSLTCFIDTNGYLGKQAWEKLMPVTDGVMLDIKAFDPSLHRQLTGKENSASLRTARILHRSGKLHELRFLVIPGKTDRGEELDRLAAFAKSLGRDIRIRLNAFQHHGVKGKSLNWPKADKELIETIRLRLLAEGLENVVTPALYV